MRERGFFHCFGCGVGGDVFKFVELQEKVNFQEAVRHLAARFGIPIPEMEATGEQRESAAEREALVKIHEVALAYFREQLASPAGAQVARLPPQGARAQAGDDRSTADRLGAAVARCAARAAAEGRLQAAAARDERPGVAPRRWGRDRSVQESPDDPDRARHRHGDRLRRPRARSGSTAEVPELARDADLYEEPHAATAST